MTQHVNGSFTNTKEDSVLLMFKDIKTLESLKKDIEYSSIRCVYCKLESLKGAPERCKEFVCINCLELETLEGAPRKCKVFDCTGCINLKNLNPLLQCDIEEIKADKHLLEDFKKKKAIIVKYGFDKAMEIIEVMDKLI